MLHVEMFDLHNNEDINYAKESKRKVNIIEKFNQKRISLNQNGSIEEYDITK